MKKFTAAQIKAALAGAPDWEMQKAAIARTFQFKDFPAAIRFVDAVAELAEQAWHHPDIDIRWNKVTLTLTTHDAGGLTKKDFVLARKFDELSLR
ncbi:MAG TPA: 4a-hydroxytetrahydrobiopterin dehydratase [Verrucomicrobiae bacterium]|nr:4a-hydroxytetrahydrobiopterin dehydratase [Verrucomicrobiae bacterium]